MPKTYRPMMYWDQQRKRIKDHYRRSKSIRTTAAHFGITHARLCQIFKIWRGAGR